MYGTDGTRFLQQIGIQIGIIPFQNKFVQSCMSHEKVADSVTVKYPMNIGYYLLTWTHDNYRASRF